MKANNSVGLLELDPYGVKTSIVLFEKTFLWLKRPHEKNTVKFIVKTSILIRILVLEGSIEEKRYLEGVYSDLLSMLNTLNMNQKRFFYFTMRSAIENILRVSLNKSDTDKTGVRDLFTQFSLYSDKSISMKLTSLYSESSNFVHNNIDACLPIGESFLELKKPCLNDNDISIMINKAEQITKCVQVVILDKYDYKMKIIFHRKKNTLKRLLGESTYKKYIADDEC